jgi:hypothetical protein
MTNYNICFNVKIDCEVQVEAESEEAAQEAAVTWFESMSWSCDSIPDGSGRSTGRSHITHYRPWAIQAQYDDFKVENLDAQEPHPLEQLASCATKEEK